MTRRTNLNSLRKAFSWNSVWTGNGLNTTGTMWFDLKIISFLDGLFYVLRLPTSNYIIRRFLTSFVIIETDIWLFRREPFVHCLPNKYYFLYVVYKLYTLFCLANKNRFKCLRIVKQQTVRNIVQYYLNTRTYIRKHSLSDKISLLLRSKRIFDYNMLREIKKSNYRESKWNLETLIKRKKKANIAVSAKYKWFFSNKSISNALNTYWTMQRYVKKLRYGRRFLFISSTFYNSFFLKYARKIINKRARLRNSVRNLHYVNSLIHATLFKRYHALFMQRINNAKMAYFLRSLWNMSVTFRLFRFKYRLGLRFSIKNTLNTALLSGTSTVI
jgi:hypothetical protein